MGRVGNLARGLWNSLRGERLDREMDEEIAFHIEARARDLTARGVPPAEAARRARVDFGGLGAVREQHRDARGVPRFEHLVRDVLHAWRRIVLGAETIRVLPYLNSVGPGYFETMGIGILRGRAFTPADRVGSPGVVVVSQAFARQAFPSGDAIGKEVELGRGERFEVVGVVKDSMYRWFGEPPQPLLYFSFAQHPVSSQARPLSVHVRSQDSSTPARSIADAIAQVDRNVTVDVRPLREAAGTETMLRRGASAILAGLGVLGLVLAMIGLYGVTSFVVASRTAEIGVRIALGASAGRVRADILRYALRLVSVGVGVGSAVAAAIAWTLSALFAGLNPLDPTAFGVPAAILLAVGALAGDIPARRATRVDPTIALREA